jgi:hypothetical protein
MRPRFSAGSGRVWSRGKLSRQFSMEICLCSLLQLLGARVGADMGAEVGVLVGKAVAVGVGMVESSRAETRVRQSNRLHKGHRGSAVTAKDAQRDLHLERKGRVSQANVTRTTCYLIYEYRQLYCVQNKASANSCPCNRRSRELFAWPGVGDTA